MSAHKDPIKRRTLTLVVYKALHVLMSLTNYFNHISIQNIEMLIQNKRLNLLNMQSVLMMKVAKMSLFVL